MPAIGPELLVEATRAAALHLAAGPLATTPPRLHGTGFPFMGQSQIRADER